MLIYKWLKRNISVDYKLIIDNLVDLSEIGFVFC